MTYLMQVRDIIQVRGMHILLQLNSRPQQMLRLVLYVQDIIASYQVLYNAFKHTHATHRRIETTHLTCSVNSLRVYQARN